MRIIAGKYKGAVSGEVKGFTSRPTMDRSREALCSIMENKMTIEGAIVLDLFAGTGMVGLEFLSRGAASLTSVEQNIFCIDAMKGLKEKYSVDGWKILRSKVESYIRTSSGSFDLIFLDPPYQYSKTTSLIQTILDSSEFLKNTSWLVAEHGPETSTNQIQGFQESRAYGTSVFSFFTPSFKL